MKSAPVKALAEVAESVRYGYTASATDQPVGPRFLRITDIVPTQIDWESVPYCQIDERDKDRFSLAPGDIVIARTGATVGYAKLIRDNPEAVFASYLVRVRIDPKHADPGYVGRIVESNVYKRFVLSRIGGAAQPNANAKVLSAFRLPIPDRSTQVRVVELMSAYDDLIENNRRRIQLLEQAARLLYKEWFVHLLFPGHEHVKVIDGVPAKWDKVATPIAIDINPHTKLSDDTEHWWVEMGDLPLDSMVIQSARRREGRGGSKFQNGDILFARITPCLENGKTAFVDFLSNGETARGSTEFIVLRSKRLSPEYVYCLSRTYAFRHNAIKSMIGSSGRQRVQESCFDKFMVLIPPLAILGAFTDIVRPIFRQIRTLHVQSQEAGKARDLLLPRLMSGEVAV